MTPAARLAEALAAGGARHAFGVPGGGPNLDMVGALNANGIEFVLAHTETAAAIMASTAGTLTGSPTACVVTRGPGAASAVNGAAQATLDRQPLILVTDTVPAASRERVPHQRLDQQAMLRPATKASMVAGEQTTVDDFVAVLATAGTAPAGAVHVDYDAAASGDTCEPQLPEPVVSTSAVDEARRLVTAAEHPVVIIGLEANDGHSGLGARVGACVTAFGAPTLSTYQGIGVIDTETQLNAGLFTNGASERPLLGQADLIVLVGVDLVEPIPAHWTYDALVISITASAATDAYLPLAVECVGDIGVLTEQVLSGSPHTWSANAGEIHRADVRSRVAATDSSDVFGPVDLVVAAAEAAPADAITTVDAGAHFLAIMPLWPVPSPQRLLISNGLATMGYAVPAAIGAAIAKPHQPVIALTGDGGLGMCLAELETIVRRQLPVTVVVFNDAALSLIEIKQRDGHGGHSAVRYTPTDFAAVAAGMGMASTVVENPSGLARAFADADGGPYLIDARVDPSAYPELIQITRG